METDYKELLEKYMLFLCNREGSCFVSLWGVHANYNEDEHMTEEDIGALIYVYESMRAKYFANP